MPSGPRPSDVPRLRLALKVYRVSAAITGTFLLLLVVMMVMRYIYHVDIAFSTAYGIQLVPKELIEEQGLINLSFVILAVHGWLYVLYLACDFIMWRLARYSFGRFLFIALGGIIPFLSYYFEFQVPRYINERIANTAGTQPTDAAEAAKEVRA